MQSMRRSRTVSTIPPSARRAAPRCPRGGIGHSIGVLRHESRREQRLLECPSRRLDSLELKKWFIYGNYGVNRFLCKSGTGLGFEGEDIQGTPLSTNAVRRPGETLLIVDSGFALVSWWNATKDPPKPIPVTYVTDVSYVPGVEINSQITLWPGQERDAKCGRHPGKTVNVGFVDGHIRQTKASELLVEKTGEDEWNYSPLWRFK
jgi:prepilin-type processing-associated H-X9-DG protein